MNKHAQIMMVCFSLLCSWHSAYATELMPSAPPAQINYLLIVLAFGVGLVLTFLSIRYLTHRRTAMQHTDKVDAELLEKMTHQARNHLSGVLLITSNLLAREDAQGMAGKLKSIRNVALRTQLLLNNYLIYTQLQNNYPVSKDSEVNLSQLFAGLVNEIGAINYQNKSPSTPIIVKGNVFLLKVAFHNLIDNAIKFSKNVPTPIITVRQKQQQTEIQLIDYGTGIPQHLLEQTFFPKGLPEGNDYRELALGLYITKQIIESHRGTILLHSNENAGTTVIITLPIQLNS